MGNPSSPAVGGGGASSASSLPPPLPPGSSAERHALRAEEELRVETTFSKSACLQVTLQRGSCELFGVELAPHKPYLLGGDAGAGGGLKLAFFTWHGCVLDVEVVPPSESATHLESCYVTDETDCNVAYVNTHAQLEVLRDEAVLSSSGGGGRQQQQQGPRVLVAGPSECGKSSLCKILTAYACKLGRTPVLVDLDPVDNMLGVPGTLAACPMNRDAACSVTEFAAVNTPPSPGGAATPLVLWHGTSSDHPSPDLFKEQVTALGQKIDRRLNNSAAAANQDGDDNDGTDKSVQQLDNERTSGIIVNTNGWIRDEGYDLLLHTIKALKINVVLVLGQDRLYSMLKTSVSKMIVEGGNDGADATASSKEIKVIKVPRSGGVVSRDAAFLRQTKSRTIKRYFYGDTVEQSATSKSGGDSSASSTSVPPKRVPQLTPFLLQIPFAKVKIYKYTAMSLSASLLPVAASQTTEPVQLEEVEMNEKLQHAVLAVCHPSAVASNQETGRAGDLYEHGVAGFVAVERVLVDNEMLHLLSPCAGSLPSNTLLMGDITWME